MLQLTEQIGLQKLQNSIIFCLLTVQVIIPTGSLAEWES